MNLKDSNEMDIIARSKNILSLTNEFNKHSINTMPILCF